MTVENSDKAPAGIGVAIAIVVGLVGLSLIPGGQTYDEGYRGPVRPARRNAAAARRTLLTQAELETTMKLYYLDHGVFPGSRGSGPDFEVSHSSLRQALESPDGTGQSYWEPDGQDMAGAIVDHWGKPLHIWIDADDDGVVVIEGERVPGRVATWSEGPNGVNEHGGGDDIALWHYKKKKED